LYEWLKQGREKGRLDDFESRRLQLLKESITEKLYDYVPERLILGGQESIDKLLRDIENSEHISKYPPKPSSTWLNAEIERLCLLSEKIKLLRKLVEKIHPEDANKYHYLHYLFEIMGDIASYVGVLERSRDELYASVGKVKIDIEQHFSKLDESIANTSRDIRRHFSELKEGLTESEAEKQDGEAGDEKSAQNSKSKEQIWDDNNHDYEYNSKVIQSLSDDLQITLATLSKLLKPDGQIRYMRKNRRCKVNVAELVSYLNAQKRRDNFSEKAFEVMEKRKANIRKQSLE